MFSGDHVIVHLTCKYGEIINFIARIDTKVSPQLVCIVIKLEHNTLMKLLNCTIISLTMGLEHESSE